MEKKKYDRLLKFCVEGKKYDPFSSSDVSVSTCFGLVIFCAFFRLEPGTLTSVFMAD